MHFQVDIDLYFGKFSEVLLYLFFIHFYVTKKLCYDFLSNPYPKDPDQVRDPNPWSRLVPRLVSAGYLYSVHLTPLKIVTCIKKVSMYNVQNKTYFSGILKLYMIFCFIPLSKFALFLTAVRLLYTDRWF